MPDLDRWENEGGFIHKVRAPQRLRALKRRHEQLENKVDAELKRPNPCSVELKRLKREKLYLKDEMKNFAA